MTYRSAAQARAGFRGLSTSLSQAGGLLAVMLFGLSIPTSHALAWQAETTAQAPIEQGSGANPALYEEDATLPAHVVYRPGDMSVLKEKLGVYIFGNGACSADGTSSRNHLLEIASHGYVAVAPGIDPARHPAPPPAPQMANGQLSAPTRASDLSDAIDWVVRENGRAGSPYYGKIDTNQIAVSGWSCGGLQALMVAPDPRVRTVIVMNSGVFNDASMKITGIEVDKSVLGRLHGSALYILGGPEDIAYKNGMDDFSRLSGLPAALVNIPVGHGGTYMQPHGGIAAEVVVNWLDWQLKGRAPAGQKFEGAACAYCQDARLTLERKNIN